MVLLGEFTGPELCVFCRQLEQQKPDLVALLAVHVGQSCIGRSCLCALEWSNSHYYSMIRAFLVCFRFPCRAKGEPKGGKKKIQTRMRLSQAVRFFSNASREIMHLVRNVVSAQNSINYPNRAPNSQPQWFS